MRIFTEISPRVAGLLVFLPLVLFCPSQTCRPGDVFGEHWKWEKCGPFLWGFPPSSPPHTAQFVGENIQKTKVKPLRVGSTTIMEDPICALF